jgi:hypothetical protein
VKRNGPLAAVLAVAGLLAPAPTVKADVIVTTFPEVNGPTMTSGFPGPNTVIATDTFTIPAGQSIVSATIAGIFGQTSQFVGSTAEFNLLVNDVQVGSTHDVTPDPFNNVVPFSFSVPPSLLGGGSATLSYIQTSEFNVRLSPTTLTITTAAAVPEPSSLLLLGASLLALGGVRVFRRAAKATAA